MGLPDKEQLQLENWNLSGFSFFSRSRSDDGGRDRRKKRSRSRSRDRHHRRRKYRHDRSVSYAELSKSTQQVLTILWLGGGGTKISQSLPQYGEKDLVVFLPILKDGLDRIECRSWSKTRTRVPIMTLFLVPTVFQKTEDSESQPQSQPQRGTSREEIADDRISGDPTTVGFDSAGDSGCSCRRRRCCCCCCRRCRCCCDDDDGDDDDDDDSTGVPGGSGGSAAAVAVADGGGAAADGRGPARLLQPAGHQPDAHRPANAEAQTPLVQEGRFAFSFLAVSRLVYDFSFTMSVIFVSVPSSNRNE